MKKLYTPNHKLYEEYYLNQAKHKGGIYQLFTDPDFSEDMA